MLDLINVRKTFNKGTINQRVALDGINLHLDDGDFVTVIGGNGAGKSTMLNAVAGVWPVDDGRIILDGEDITALPDYKRAKYIGRVFQDPMMGTAPNMQLEENLALAMRRGQRRGLGWGVTRAEREEYREKLRGLGLVDITTAGWEPSEEDRQLLLDIESLAKAAEFLKNFRAGERCDAAAAPFGLLRSAEAR